MRQLTTTELTETLSARLQEADISLNSHNADAVVDVTVRQLKYAHASEPEPQRRLDRDLLKSDVVYAVPDQALELFPASVRAVIAALGTGPFAALPDLVAILFRYRCLRIELTAEEAAILTVLKQAKLEMRPPLSVADIHDALTRDQLTLQHPLTDLLASLKSKKTDEATLVHETGGRWAIGNV